MDKINEFLDLIDEFKGPINSEIKDDDQAEQVWSLINDLENKLEEVKMKTNKVYLRSTRNLYFVMDNGMKVFIPI